MKKKTNTKSRDKSGPKTTANSQAKIQPKAKTRSKSKLKHSKLYRKVKTYLMRQKANWQEFRKDRVRLHRSFRRSYREDYMRKTETPGLLSHAMTTFQVIFKHWRTFLPFIGIMTAMYIVLVGLMSEDLYQQFQDSIDDSSAELANGKVSNFAKAGLLLISTVTTGGLSTGMGEVQIVFMLLLFLIMWLTTIYLLRHFLAGGKPRLRDGLYNALSPLISTLLVFVVIFIQAIPLMLVIITFSAAKLTNFLETPFYALVYFIFASLMILISIYLLSSSLIALVAVTAPGVYPMRALFSASDLMAGRRTRFILRVLYLIVVVTLIYVITITPVILLDMWLKSIWEWIYGVPIVPFCLLIVTCFVFIYATTYFYRYYRWLLDYQEK